MEERLRTPSPRPVAFPPPQAPRNEAVAGPSGPEDGRRWESEARFFDAVGDRLLRDLAPTPTAVLSRYLDRPRALYDKELRFRLVGSLAGQVALDLGCGDGSNAVLLARRGAYVEGVDVSPRIVEVARRRAELDGVQDRVHFQCQPVEQVSFPPATFDLVWGDGVLHHLGGSLVPVLGLLERWAKPGALFVFSEPVAESPLLRRLRSRVPVHTDATPDERPLGARELALLRRFLPKLRERRFDALGRLTRLLLPLADYEGASAPRRLASDALHAADRAILSIPALRPLGGTAVFWGRR